MGRSNGRSATVTPLPGVPVPPQDLHAEEAVLGAALLSTDGALVGRFLEMGLGPDDFFRDTYGTIFATLVAIHQRGGGTDALTLKAELKRLKLLDGVGGAATLDAVADAVPSLGNALDYARVVRRVAMERRRVRAALAVVENPADEAALAHLVEIAETPIDVSPHSHRLMDLEKAMSLAETEPPWRCRGLFADGYLTTLVGVGGEGKSLLALALAGGVQLGSTVAGIECSMGRVVIFDAENGERLMGSRIKAAQLPLAGLEVYDGDGLDLHRHRGWIVNQCRGAQLVIFDSIRTLAPGAKENDSDDMAPVMGAMRHVARTTGAAVGAIHHRGKGELDYRGSSSIRDQTDLMFVLERAARDPEARWRRRIRCVKCRIAEEPVPRWIGIRVWRELGQIALTEAAPYEDDQSEAPVRDQLAEQINELLSEEGPMTRPAVSKRLGREKNDGTVRRAMEGLAAEGRIVETTGYRWVVAGVATAGVATPGNPEQAQLPDDGCQLKGAATVATPSEDAS